MNPALKRGDLLWTASLLLIVSLLLVESSRHLYVQFTTSYPYLSGFLKYMILASMGELLSLRLKHRHWTRSTGFLTKALLWGIMGMLITFVFRFYFTGVRNLQNAGLLFGRELAAVTAFLSSLIMNLTFGISLFIGHRISDEIVEYRIRNSRFVKISAMIASVNWPEYLSFVLKLLLFFWIPVHTIVFLLPDTYRVMAAAFLSILLGVFLSLGNRRRNPDV